MLQNDLADQPTNPALQIGLGAPATSLGRYEIECAIGRGMMGVVYKARDPLLGRPVALKILRLDFPMRPDERRQLELRFLREATLAAALSHPNIVAVYDVGRDPPTDTPFIALEYLEGRTLAEVMAPVALDWRDALRLTARLALALHHAHAHGVIHRDIKPSNVIVLRSGEPKILDFGIARASTAQLTSAGEAWGTPSYMSPEQASASAVDGRSDLFSLGAVLYEMLTGRRAFGAESVTEVMARVLRDEPPLPAASNPVLPPDVDLVLARALAKDKERRYPDGLTFAEDLEDVLDGRPIRERRGLRGSVEPVELVRGPVGSGPVDAASSTWTTRVPGTTGRRVREKLRLGPGFVMGAALAATLMYVRTGSEPVATSADSLATTAPLLAPAFDATVPFLAPALDTAPPAPALATTAPSPAPATTLPPAPVPSVEPTPAPIVEPPVDPVEPARIALSIEHGFKEGRVKVWVDDTLVLERALAGMQTKGFLFIKRRKGTFAEVLEVPPGERTLRVEALADGETRSGELKSLFQSEETRLLEIKLGDKVELDWKG